MENSKEKYDAELMDVGGKKILLIHDRIPTDLQPVPLIDWVKDLGIVEKKILIVDDNEMMRRLNADIIKHSDKFQEYKLELASDGSKAIELMKQNDYCVVISDYEMPLVDGAGLHKWMRENLPQKVSTYVLVASLRSQESLNFVENYKPRFIAKGAGGSNDLLLKNLEEILKA